MGLGFLCPQAETLGIGTASSWQDLLSHRLGYGLLDWPYPGNHSLKTVQIWPLDFLVMLRHGENGFKGDAASLETNPDIWMFLLVRGSL